MRIGGAINMKTLKEAMTQGKLITGFTNHFQTKSSVKNLLSGYKNPKGSLNVLFLKEEYAKEMLAYANIEEQLTEVLIKVCDVCNVKFEEAKTNKELELRNLQERVEFFRGLIDEECAKTNIGANLGDFMKTSTGKELEKIIAEVTELSDAELDDAILDISLSIVSRALINKTLADDEEPIVEKVEGEVVVESEVPVIENAAKKHAEEKVEKSTKEPETEKAEVSDSFNLKGKMTEDNMKELLKKAASMTDSEIEHMVESMRPYIVNNMDIIKDTINSYVPKNFDSFIEYLLPIDFVNVVNGISVYSVIGWVTDIYYDACEKGTGNDYKMAAKATVSLMFLNVMKLVIDGFDVPSMGSVIKTLSLGVSYADVPKSYFKKLDALKNEVAAKIPVNPPTMKNLFSPAKYLGGIGTGVEYRELISWINAA